MEITKIGHSMIKVRTKGVTVIFDPFDPDMLSLKYPKQKADIIVISHEHEDHNFIKNITDASLIIRGAGEYESKGVRISGFETYHDKEEGKSRGRNIVYSMESEGIFFVHLGDLGYVMGEKELDNLEGCDILAVPTGGHFTIDAKEAAQIIRELEPSIAIPMHYYFPQINQAIFKDLAPLDDFLALVKDVPVVRSEKLNVKKADLTGEKMIAVI